MSFNKKTLIWIGSTALVLIAIAAFLLIPFIQDISGLTKQNYDKRVRLAIVKKQSSNISVMKRDYNKIQDDIKKISQVFIPKKETINFITNLENMAAQDNLTQKIQLQGIKISDLEQTTTEVKELPLQLTLSGDFNSIMKYLNQIEALNYYINFSKLNFTGSGTSVNLTISGLTYWQ